MPDTQPPAPSSLESISTRLTQREAELAVIKSVQEGLASRLSFQAIVDLVGDQVRAIFSSNDMSIALYNPATNLLSMPYFYEDGKRFSVDATALTTGFTAHVLHTRQPLMINENQGQRSQEMGAVTIGDKDANTSLDEQSYLGVPILNGEQALGVMALYANTKHAFNESHLSLLSTLAASLGGALENARLFDESQRLFKAEQQRAAELQIINSIQLGLVSKLEFRAIIDLVGDKLSQVLNTRDLGIRLYDEKTDLLLYPYEFEHGERLQLGAQPPSALFRYQQQTRESIVGSTDELVSRFNLVIVPGTEVSQSIASVPIVSGDKVIGSIMVEDHERQNAFSDTDIRLMQTIAASMGVALENARLFDETQRLLKAEQQRAAELAIINSVQQGLAAKLDFQSIIDLVGDKMALTFDSQAVIISLYIKETRQISHRYILERKQRLYFPQPAPIDRFRQRVVETRQPWLINEHYRQIAAEIDERTTMEGEEPKALLFAPMIVGDDVTGVVSLQNLDRENAFTESDVRLLTTLVNSMSVALENARLFDETQRLFRAEQQRAAELSIINSVQAGLASQLELQTLYELIGEKVRTIFDAQIVTIVTYDQVAGLLRHQYYARNGVRLQIDPAPLSDFARYMIQTRQPLLINDQWEQRLTALGIHPLVIDGDQLPKSTLFVPLMAGDRVQGALSLQNVDREQAFSDPDVRLLGTLANSLSIALENARLFEAEQQRASELSIINSVSQALAAQLELDALVDLIGEQMRQTFGADIVYVALHDRQTGLINFPYYVEDGVRQTNEPIQYGQGMTSLILETRQPLLLNSEDDYVRINITRVGTHSKSYLGVPIVTSEGALGAISVQSTQQEGRFTSSDERLLTTIAANVGVALQNARLYQEVQHRAKEMATLAEIGNDIATSRELTDVLERIVNHAQTLMRVRDIAIYLRETDGRTFRAPVAVGKYVDEIKASPTLLGQGITGNIARTGVAEMVNYPMRDPRVFHIPGTAEGDEEEQEGLMCAPLISRGQTIGLMTVWRPHADGLFSQSELEFLISVARQAAIAIESARLYLETQRRANEMAALADVGREISASLNLSTVLDRIAGQALKLLTADTSAVYLPDATGQVFTAIISLGEQAEEIRADSIVVGEGVIGDLARRAAAEYVNNTAQDPRAIQIPGTPEDNEERLMAVPLLVGQRLAGMMAVWRTFGEPFTDTELNFLVGLSRQAAIALENARLFDETNQRAAELGIINRLGQALASEVEATAVIDLVGDKLRELFGVQYIYIALHDPARNQIQFPYFWDHDHRGPDEESMPYGGLTARILESRQPQLINSNWLAEATRLGATVLTGELPKASLGVPILVADMAIGVIMLQSTERENRFSESDTRLLSTIAANVGVAIQNARLYAERERRASETAALNEIGREISASLEMEVVLERIAARAMEILRARDVVLRLLEPDGRLPAAVAVGKYAENYRQSGIRVGRGLTGHIVQTGIAEIVNDPPNDPRTVVVEGTQQDDSNEVILFAPLIIGDTVTGILCIWRDKAVAGLFTQFDLDFAVGLARQAAIAIQNARLFAQTESQRQYFESLVEYSPAAIATTDLAGKVVSWNPAAENLFGYTAAEALGHTLPELIATSDEAPTEANDSLYTDRLKTITRRNRKDGSLVDVEQLAVAVRVAGEARGTLAIYHDITELQQARREAEAANASKSAFLATMSHEIRTPMNGIIGMTGLLLDTELSREQQEYTNVIRNSGESLLAIINDILDFSKIESGKMDLENRPFDLRDCVESALDLVSTTATDKKLDLAYVIEDDVPAALMGDVTRLRQILLNLLSNAVKFTETGEVVLHISLLPLPKTKTLVADAPLRHQLHFAVRDTGIGIPADRLDRLFQSFSQLDSSTTRKYGGTGLGLAISKRLSELMGGSMWAASGGHGRGSVFHFTIVATAAPEVKARLHLGDTHPQLQGKHILIVDDNATNRRILTGQLQKWGLATRVAATGPQALQWLKNGEKFDAAILDLYIADMDGYTLAREIRKLQSGLILPLLLFSSLNRRDPDAQSGLFVGYLTKPLKPSQLYDILVEVLAVAQASQSVSQPAATLIAGAGPKALNILLAEDNVVNQMLAQRLLNQMGYGHADLATNGLEAIAALEREDYDVILMDIQMPEMDGLEATRRIVARWPAGRRPRIIAMTANAMQGDREMCIAAGMDDYLAKPIRPEELQSALGKSPLRSKD